MTIAQPDESGVHTLEFLQQSISLGKDTFTVGRIRQSSIEECVAVLRSFRKILGEYGVTQPDQLRAVATTAVREASNRDAFVDRIYIATGIEVEPIEDAEVMRLTYMGIQPLIDEDPALSAARVIVVEVGGGNTELLVLQGGDVVLSRNYRLGSLRLRQSLETFRAPAASLRDIMVKSIDRVVDQIRQEVSPGRGSRLMVMGADARFAAGLLRPGHDPESAVRMPTSDLSRLTGELLGLSVDELARRHHLAFPDAETVAPSLLVYEHLARGLGLKSVLVVNRTMRHGILREMAGRESWTPRFRDQMLHSALALARKYHTDEAHVQHVGRLAKALFDVLASPYQLGGRDELLLGVASILHDVGLFVSDRSHHKHSMYIIASSEIFGLSPKDIGLISLVCRYHRRSTPKPSHVEFQSLTRDERLTVCKLAAILRVADALDRSHSQRIDRIRCEAQGERFVITVPGVSGMSLEQMALQEKGTMFEEVYGSSVVLRREPH